jgi:two-component system, chemotaxis family, protein-glutamate methylesterase/glutaminase
MGKPIRVMVVDDSALMRKLLTEILGADPELEVVATAGDPFEARDRIKAINPDVLTLDVEMPKMDGVAFLRNLMRLRPMPVVMVSSLTERGAEVTLSALEAGAFDFVTKPKLDLVTGMHAEADALREVVKAAARSNCSHFRERPRAVVPKVSSTLRTTEQLIVIGASTGGTEAVASVLNTFPPDAPATLIAQHIPAGFSRSWAQRLHDHSALTVREAVDGEPALVGHAYVAPGGYHLRILRSGARYLCRVSDDAPVNRHRPSVDALFDSVAERAGSNAVGIILTGMGADGARGLLKMRTAGCPTIAQDEASAVVWSMPGEAVKLGAALEVLPLSSIANRALQLARRSK